MRLIIERCDQRFRRAKSLQSIQALLLHKAFLPLIVKWSAAKLTLEYRFVSDRDLFKTPSEMKAGAEVPQGSGKEYGEMNMLHCWIWVWTARPLSFSLTDFYNVVKFTSFVCNKTIQWCINFSDFFIFIYIYICYKEIDITKTTFISGKHRELKFHWVSVRWCNDSPL